MNIKRKEHNQNNAGHPKLFVAKLSIFRPIIKDFTAAN